MDYEDFGNEELAKKIDERKKIIKKIIKFMNFSIIFFLSSIFLANSSFPKSS